MTTRFTATSTAAEVVAGLDLSARRAVVTGGASGIGVETDGTAPCTSWSTMPGHGASADPYAAALGAALRPSAPEHVPSRQVAD
ncbi:hypothetical protein ACQP2T_31245 [Nonomuraea sp. CA-143628]|uniref:hypothetical protein n=1 Tax=Nonomuraea sp. CA-143628 TaxID=3239997 RepID=UPI003D9440C2